MIRRRFRPRRRSQRGFTLIELMVSLVLFALVVTGLMAVAVSMITGYRDQEVTISTETATRSTIDFLTNALHNASPGVPTFTNLGSLDASTCPVGAIAIESNQVTPLANTSDKLTVTFASGGVVTTSSTTWNGGNGSTMDVVDATQIASGDYVVVTNFDVGHFVRVSASTGTKPGTLTFSQSCTTPNPAIPTGGYVAGATVIRAMRARFSISVLPSDDVIGVVPVLNMDSDAEGTLKPDEPIAEGIEDLQVVYAADNLTADGVISPESTTGGADEWYGNVVGEAVPLPLPNATRAVRVTIVARTTRQFSGVNAFVLKALEDRAANSATDNFRRRILSTTVEIRNLSGSP